MKKIKRTELTDHHHSELYNDLKKTADDISQEISGEYDYGLTMIECNQLKDKITTKVLALLGEYQRYLQDKFEEMCKETMEVNNQIWNAITSDNKDDIDKTIQQMQYIESLKQKGAVNDTWSKLNKLQNYKFLLDDMKIMVRQDSFEKAQKLYAFPQALEA